MINVMHNYLTKKIKPNYPFYKFLILNTSSYSYEIVDILKDVIGEVEVIGCESFNVIFYFNNVDVDFKSLIKTINDDFSIEAHLFESGKLYFSDTTEYQHILDLYKAANLNKYIYSSNRNLLNYLINKDKKNASLYAPILLNKFINDEAMMMLARSMFDCDLNISKTSQNIYMHRNTVNYKLEQIKDETGLDIRKFKDAVIMYEFMKII